ncbi:MAG: hypothetical protein SFT93_05245 [Rickettsiaceae bacterium]|nr:hypothetical protein [Rickettsiaceae bacterium]
MKFSNFLFIFYLLACTMNTHATNSNKDSNIDRQAVDKEKYFKEIIQDYKEYLLSVPKDVRAEIEEFRREMKALNKKKRDLYKSLSRAAQDYLKNEESFRRKLPIGKLEETEIAR